MMALRLLDRTPRESWPRILGAAAGFGVISPNMARDILGLEVLEVPGWPQCRSCGCRTQITCPDCGQDACARCWRCATAGCGPEPNEEHDDTAAAGDLGLLAR